MNDQPLRISLHAIRSVAHERMPGYVDAVLAASVKTTDTHVYLTAAAYVTLQKKFAGGPIIGTPPVPKLRRRPYHELWAALHTACNPSPQLVADVRPHLPMGGCGCLQHFDAMLSDLPPVYSPLTAWRMRVTDWHNRVNIRRNKRPWSYAESDARWPLT